MLWDGKAEMKYFNDLDPLKRKYLWKIQGDLPKYTMSHPFVTSSKDEK
jgi:hypothetical protein